MNESLLKHFEDIKTNDTDRLSGNSLLKDNIRISRYKTSDVTKCENQDPNHEKLRSTTMELKDELDTIPLKETTKNLKSKRNKSCYCYFILWLGLVLNLAWLAYGVFSIYKYCIYDRHTAMGSVKLLAFWIITPMAFVVGLLVGLIKTCKFKKKLKDTMGERSIRETDIITKFNIA